MSHVWTGKSSDHHYTRKSLKNGKRRMVLPHNPPKTKAQFVSTVNPDLLHSVRNTDGTIRYFTQEWVEVVFPIVGDEFGLDINA